MANKLRLMIYCMMLALAAGCEKNPLGKLVNPTSSNSAGVWSGKWVLFNDEIKTGGEIMVFNEGTSIDFNSKDGPHSGDKCIRYSWDGSPVLTYKSPPAHPADYVQSDFTGFSLICAKNLADYSTSTRDLTEGGYTKITFWARGQLNANVYLRVESNSIDPNFYKLTTGSPGVWMGTVTSDWKQYTIPLDKSTNSLVGATDFVKFIFRYDEDGNPDTANAGRGNGGTVFIDDIELSK